MIPACFSQPNTVSSHNNTSNHQIPQNLITCIYQCHFCSSPTYLTLTWSKTPFSHSLTIYATDSFSITISLNPSTFSFFKSRPSSKSIYLTHHCQRIKLYWDFTRAEFTRNSAKPDSGFYVAISCNTKLEFFLGDLHDELTWRSGLAMTRQLCEPTLLSRREHVFGRRNYVSWAQFLGTKHEIGIECSRGVLKVEVDGEIRLVVKRLAWKFRGTEKIYVGGIKVEFFWDVFNWVNNISTSNSNNNNSGTNGIGHGVFVFQVGDGRVWPEMVGPEKRLMRKSLSVSSSSGAIGDMVVTVTVMFKCIAMG
ncbi:uncharacterized protein LOC136062633 [Quercus suber]|uniref:Uncharacterized protein n=1 Tax=Quercus suber TaxID=58331 RepID=A0AAW0K236_QUESU